MTALGFSDEEMAEALEVPSEPVSTRASTLRGPLTDVALAAPIYVGASPEWGHGVWKGELLIGAESWRVAEQHPLDLNQL